VSLPAIQRDRGEVARRNYEITTIDGKVVTAGEVSDDVLARLQAGKLRRSPEAGPNNALGLIKLMFPNEYSCVSTQHPAARSCFHAASVIFSAGCIRVERPAELGALALRNNPVWSVETRAGGNAKRQGRRHHNSSPSRARLHWLRNGHCLRKTMMFHFYDDIYGHDAALAKALA
jgi:murein L,D-transpeptidase YcbB/YkuD